MKTKNVFLIFLLFFGVDLLFAQGENNNWYFGQYAALNFQNPTPVGISTSSMNALEACGSVSDNNGNLLFYMSGEKIWNKQNQIMPNGVLLPPNQNDSAQQLAIVKNPANSNQYYVFTTGENNYTNSNFRINYSIVDMTLANGLGDVVPASKNVAVLDNLGNIFMSEAVTIVPNSSDGSFWVLIPNGTKLYSYKLSNTGFNNGNPVISNLNFPVNLNQYQYYSIKSSPKVNNSSYSHYICISFWKNNIISNFPDSDSINKIYSFNSTTGQITSDFSLQVNGLRAYLPEFNKDASVLFLGYTNIYAVDLISSITGGVQSMEIYHEPSPATAFPIGSIQRNKHGDVYVNKPSSPYLGRITSPDVYSSNMGVNLTAVGLISGGTRYGLPQLIPVLETSGYYPCIDNLTLTSESNNIFYYEIGNKITTKDNYVIGSRHNITMQAGESVNLLNGTHIQAGAIYYAFIAPCGEKEEFNAKSKQNLQKDMILELDQEERKQRLQIKNIDIYPNPVSELLTVKTDLKIENVSVNDMSGKNINVTLRDNKVDVRNLPAGSYIITIETKEGKTTKKFIKK
ncbi:T9SS type A sorting domain-containing protein [Chryseobacterium camelliae]|uniref:T9SS type A sorting domain-containing protein n=1 Tax=Chryseobacterium camelliae TaxID=1265445 RepID=A0ABY7QN68_9FLAO|nr:T9SS type A sorting domain-containing protein [Chryseobacterium camelliae]WBV60146.1 T9SS type A sorting domain-containing protein [Chryseobacterium camelliae]